MVAPLEEIDDGAVLEAVPLVDPAPAEPVGVPEVVAVDIVEPVDAVDAVEPVEAVEAVEAVDIVDMPEVDIETEDPPPEAGEELDRVNWPDCARMPFVSEPMRLIWKPPPVPVRLLTV